jgi:hypothetical protein
MSIEVAIPLLLLLILIWWRMEVNTTYAESLEKRVKELEGPNNPDRKWVEARDQHHRYWPKEDR